VAGLEAEMASIEAMMENLSWRRTNLRRKFNSLSPTALLPVEILAEIFRLTCQLEDELGGPSVTPLFFGGICKDWREIAWSTPLLWNMISLHVSRKAHGFQVQLLRDWLLRANSSPLFIELTSDDEHKSIFCSLRIIMDVLVTRSTYWKSLDCLLPPQYHDILKNNHFPMLTSVSLRPPKGTISIFCEPPNMFLSAPKLLDVDLSGYNYSAMMLPWEQLRRFKTQVLTVAECLKVLKRSPSLKECHLESVYSPEIFPSPVPLENFYSELEHLDITLIRGAAVSLFDNITLPSLSQLRVHYSGAAGFNLSTICSLVLRSSCNLQRLCIEKWHIHDEDLIPCLESVPSLSHLRLVVLGESESAGLSKNFVLMMHPSRDSGPPLLPKLTSFHYEGPVECDSHSLVDMLSERWCAQSAKNRNAIPIATLNTAKIVSHARYELTDDVECKMRWLRKGGMDLSIRSVL
jgi:F-box-like